VESCEVIVRTQLEASRTATGTTCQKIDNLKLPRYDDKENVLSLDRTPVATIKRIRREKTGTDWQTVLDVVRYGKEQRKKTPAVTEDK
jgi:hypothetical protein